VESIVALSNTLEPRYNAVIRHRRPYRVISGYIRVTDSTL